MPKYKILGFIPARSGSKRLKDKNLRLFLGNPLIYHTIKFSKKISLSDIFVSTDSKRILSYCKNLNIDNDYLRPKKLSGDKSQITDAILHCLKWLSEKRNKHFDAVMMLQPTTPYRNVKEINSIIKIFKNKNYDSLATVSKANNHPYHIFQIAKKNNWNFLLKKRISSLNKQDLPKNYFVENGHVYLFKTKFLKKHKKFIVKNKTILFKQKTKVIDIDYLDDFKICEFRVKNKIFN